MNTGFSQTRYKKARYTLELASAFLKLDSLRRLKQTAEHKWVVKLGSRKVVTRTSQKPNTFKGNPYISSIKKAILRKVTLNDQVFKSFYSSTIVGFSATQTTKTPTQSRSSASSAAQRCSHNRSPRTLTSLQWELPSGRRALVHPTPMHISEFGFVLRPPWVSRTKKH